MATYEVKISETRHYTLRVQVDSDEAAREYMQTPLYAMEQITGARYEILNVERVRDAT